MTRFVLRRLAWSLACVWFVVSATWATLVVFPADPARTLVGPHAGEETVLAVRHQLCLDRSFLEQYGCYVGRLATGDLGTSFATRRPVAQIIADRIGPTVELALAAIALQLLLGLPLGALAAARRGRPAAAIADGVAMLGQCAPTFFIGPLFMYLLAYRTGLLPVSGRGAPGWDRLAHLVLPALTLAVAGLAAIARVTRNELIAALDAEHVRTARAKGLGEGAILVRHALRNALPPVVTLISLELGVLLGGAIVTEHIFAWPGLGREAVQAIRNVDLPVVLGIVTVGTTAIVIANLGADLLCAWLDPRIRYR